MSNLGDRLDKLTPEKRALLERQLLQRRASVLSESGRDGKLHRRGPDEPLLLSYSQQQLWFLQEWQKEGAAYNASLNLRLQGELDEDALRQSFQLIIERHETLRTVVMDEGGVPGARLIEHPTFAFHEVDLGADGPPSDEAIADAVRGVVHLAFDLSADLMLRVGLIRLGPDDRVICMVLHHIACDGWSRGILFDELTALYVGFTSGHPAELAELPVQYGDFAKWQQEWLSGSVLKGEIDFWSEELSGADFVLDLPTDHVRPNVLTFIGGRMGFVIPAPVADRMRSIGREERATIFMVVHAATGMLLNSLTGQEDFLVGSPVGSRRWPETEPLIGFFVNTLLLRLRMTGDPTFRELVRRCRETAVSCYAHQDIPFERIVQALRPKRYSDRNPLFQVNLRMQGPAPEPPELPGLRASRVSVGLGSSRFDLALGFVDAPGELGAYVEYNSALFEGATIERWMHAFTQVLELACENPERKLSELATALRAKAGVTLP
ncbi:MAG TPA: condensation domain-containing protein [Acidimicrobiales bacterium]